MIIFHGGCHGCLTQGLFGVDNCYNCRYFEADWSKPDLSDKALGEAEIVRRQVIARRARG